MIHIITGEEAAKNLTAAFELDENLQGDIVILKDHLGVGPLSSSNETEEISHDTLRSAFWNTISPQVEPWVMDDEAKILALITKVLEEEEPCCFWLAPNVTDVCAYLWLLPFFKKHPSVLHTINVIGLPFLNEKGQMFYPNTFAQIPPKEFVKTKRLLKEVSPAEYEVEGDEWARLQAEQTWVRTHEGGKKVASKENAFVDSQLKTIISAEFQKAHKVVNEAFKKSTQTIPAAFFEYRLRKLIEAEAISVQGDVTKTSRDFEVKKIGESIPENTEEVVV